MCLKMIRFKDINVNVNGRYILKDFNLEIRNGEKVLLYGKSGSGKSTLFNLLLGFRKPDSGTICFRGSEVNKKTVWDLRKRTGYVSQELDLGENRVGEFINHISAYHANHEFSFEKEEIRKYIDYFELPEDILGKYLQEISGGEKQRLAIIIALLLQRNIFLLDEVTAALDGEMKKKVVQLFTEHKKWTVLVASHDAVWLEKPGLKIIKLQEP